MRGTIIWLILVEESRGPYGKRGFFSSGVWSDALWHFLTAHGLEQIRKE